MWQYIKVGSIISLSCIFFLVAYAEVPFLPYRVVHRYQLAIAPYLEGLIIDHQQAYISSGRYSHSYLACLDLASGKIRQQHALDPNYFAEGIAKLGDKIYQLTYLSNTVLIYDTQLNLIGQFYLPFEGWGLTTDGKNLIMTNGSSHVLFISPTTHHVIKELAVKLDGKAVTNLNDLAYHQGLLYINIFTTPDVIMISADNGEVKGLYNFSALQNDEVKTQSGCVLNGLAIFNHHLFVGQKCSPYLYELAL